MMHLSIRLVLPAAIFLGIAPGMLWLPFAGSAHDRLLYRCSGRYGETVFSGQRTGYRHCHRLASQATASRPGEWSSNPLVMPAVADALKNHNGAVYRVVRANGSVEYTNNRPRQRPGHVTTTLIFSYRKNLADSDKQTTFDWKKVPLHRREQVALIRNASRYYGIREAFLRAIIHAESAFRPHALSARGAQGLMQLMPATARTMGVDDAFDPGQNILAGSRYLAGLLKTFHGNERLAAAAYNAGPAAVTRYRGVPPYAQTKAYVRRVDVLRQRYGNRQPGHHDGR